MYLNSFSVRVLGGKELPGGYVELAHGQSYRLVLRNDRPTDCDARAEIDGKAVGTWRIPRQASMTLDRPAHDDGRFTFFEVDSADAGPAGLTVGDPNLGLVKVTFTPGQAPRPLVASPVRHLKTESLGERLDEVPCATSTASAVGETTTIHYDASANTAGFVAGGTGLTGTSSQVFGEAAPIVPDLTQQTVIHLRLVGRHRRPDDQPRPLTAYSTPVPPAVR